VILPIVSSPMSVSPSPTFSLDLSRGDVPRLLVSVRNSEEALSAIAGGCDILDVKEPDRGSLGMADLATLMHIIGSVPNDPCRLEISAALGEVTEWQRGESPRLSAGQSLPAGCDLLKIGCAGLGTDSNWRTVWNQTRQAISASMLTPPRWVAVGYVDWQAADAPQVNQIVQAAIEDDCRGVLLDTFTKSGRWLLDWISVVELQSIAEQVHAQGLFLALAGSLSIAKMIHLKTIPADILAIRGAACRQGERRSEITVESVQAFKSALGQQYLDLPELT